MTTDKSMFAYFNEGTAHLPRTNRTVSFYGRELTLGEVMAEIDGFAARLTEIGVGKGKYNFAIALPKEEKKE